MPPPLPESIRNAIVKDLKAGVTTTVIEEKYNVSQGVISKIAAKNGLSRKRGRKRKRISHRSRKTPRSSIPCEIEIYEFSQDERIKLIDAGLSHLKALLGAVEAPKGMSDWSTALDKLLNQRRLEKPKEGARSGLAEIREHLKAQREAMKDAVGNVPSRLQGS